MCLEAKKRCSPLMRQYGFKWPITLSCEQLPRINDQQITGNICAAPPDTPDPSVLDHTDVRLLSHQFLLEGEIEEMNIKLLPSFPISFYQTVVTSYSP